MHKKKSIKDIILYLFLFIIILIIINALSEPKSTTNNSEEEIIKYNVGDIVKFENMEFKLLSAEIIGDKVTSNNIFVEDKNTDGKFVKVRFNVKNISKKEIEFNYFTDKDHPKVYDSEEREYKYIDNMGNYLSESYIATNSLFENTKIQPGFDKNFEAIYEVPNNSKDLKIRINSLNSSNKTQKDILLGF